MSEHPLLVILLCAAIAPVFNELQLRLPLVVLELLLGMLVGPHGLGWVHMTDGIRTLSALGLSFLFLMAGMEIDFALLRGRALNLAGAGWLISILLGVALTFALQALGVVSDPLLVAVALSTTAIGTLIPIMRDAGELDSEFGRLVLGAGAVGEFGPIVLFTLISAGHEELATQSGLLALFVLIALACAALAMKLRPPHVIDVLARSLHATSQLPVRIAMFLLGSMVTLAEWLGVDLLLGAFAAGSLVGLVARGPEGEPFRHKLDALGFGFLIPIFFVCSGTQVDIDAMTASPATLVRAPLFLALLLLVRGAPALLYRSDLDRRGRLRLALLSSTSLPLIVVITSLGVATGHMLPENAAALVSAGIASVLLFPLIALALRDRTGAA